MSKKRIVFIAVSVCLFCASAASLRERLASGECGALDEIVFATRTVSEDPHWYANLSYFGRSAEAPAYSRCGRLIAYNVKNGSYRVILSDPAGAAQVGENAQNTIPMPWENILETAVERYTRLIALGREGKLSKKYLRVI